MSNEILDIEELKQRKYYTFTKAFLTLLLKGDIYLWNQYRNNIGLLYKIAGLTDAVPTPAYDRTGTFESPISVIPSPPIPDHSGFKKTFKEVALERAAEIIKTGRPIDIFWSGGIDSTCILIAFLMVAKDKGQITIKMNNKSIRENPQFFKDHIENKLYYEAHEIHFNLKVTPQDSIGVSGYGAHSIFGTNRDFDGKGNDDWHTFYNRSNLMEQLELLASKSPIPIKTVFDMNWWIRFTLLYEDTKRYSLASMRIRNKDDFDSWQPFFLSPDFDRWVLTNPEQRISGEYESYKRPERDLIYEYTKDSHYRDTKLAHPSSPRRAPLFYDQIFPYRYHALDENFNQISNKQLMELYNRISSSKP